MAKLSPNQGDYIYRRGFAPETKVAMSIKNKVYSFIPGGGDTKVQIGAMSAFTLSESRGVDPIRGIGYGDQIAELVPSVTEPMTIHVERAMLYSNALMQAFGYWGGVDGVVRSLKHHRWPFDVKQELVLSQIAAADAASAPELVAVEWAPGVAGVAVITIFEACWMNSYGVDFPADTTQVVENCDISVSDVLASGKSNIYTAPMGNEMASERFKPASV